MDKNRRKEVLKLMDEKDALEKEIRELYRILEKNNVGLDDPLVDNEGFPLSHIDIYQVRHTRHLIIHKQNDHKALMKRIEVGINEYYANPDDTGSREIQIEPAPQHLEPFARISVVHPGSPTDQAGIHDGDYLVEFGSVNATNFRNLSDIGAVVQHSEGHKINVKVKRDNRYVRVSLTPRKWSGGGLLGCNVVPV